MTLSRRHFIQRAVACSAGFAGLSVAMGRTTRTQPLIEGYGLLRPDPQGIIDLPPGFTYQTLSRTGETMGDGLRVPAKHDAMAAFPGPNGLTLVIRNHEVTGRKNAAGPFESRDSAADFLRDCYDPGTDGMPAPGGTTTIVYDTREQQMVDHFLSLAGSERNCAGGATPRNTWITCEETVALADDLRAKDHGYCFEVPATREPSLARPVPITGMGRMNHEACATDPASGVVYLTEDRGDSLLYRYVPENPDRLLDGGRLQALALRNRPRFDTRNWEEQTIRAGEMYRAEWIDIDDVESPDDSLRKQGYEKGAARFARGEGMWFGDGSVYFACTNGGPRLMGQIFRYTPSPAEGAPAERDNPGKLRLFIESTDPSVIENADNITFAPWGDIIGCEDGSGEQFLFGITPAGDVYKLGRNAMNESEFAGACFSPDGSTLFVNIQNPGITLAIRGPWKRA